VVILLWGSSLLKGRRSGAWPAACDVGAVIYFLRKLSWVVPDFTVTKYRDQLLRLHEQIEAEGSFVTHTPRVLIDVRKPG